MLQISYSCTQFSKRRKKKYRFESIFQEVLETLKANTTFLFFVEGEIFIMLIKYFQFPGMDFIKCIVQPSSLNRKYQSYKRTMRL